MSEGPRERTAPSEPVEALVARGDYAGAATRAAADGDLRRAIQLWERIWRFADALPLALALGDRPLAVRLALDARDPARAAAIAREIPDGDTEGLKRAAAALAGRGQHHVAAELEARAGRLEEAAALYRRAGATLEAARTLERAGRIQEAGRLYEELAAVDGGAVDRHAAAEAQLEMGRLLAGLGRPHEAARALQAAARHPETRLAALRRLCGPLLALGLRHAAAAIARRVHGAAPEIPPDAEAIAAIEQGGLAAPALPRRFRVLRALGAGALARVYAADDELLGRTVALKVLAVGPGAAGPERDAFARFLREAEAAGRLRHPHIAALHEIDEAAGLMVLEHLPGGTLAERLARDGRLGPASARRLALDLLAGLAAAHRAGIVHRDVKPANVFFDAAGNAKLGDFGAAHLLDFGHTQTGSFIGTLAYLSPEQITGAAITHAADLYGLAATLYEALTGRPPFLGPDIVGQHLSEQPVAPSVLRPGLAPAHDEVLLRGLAKAPGDRFSSAEAMAAAIEQWPAHEPRAPRPAAPPAPAAAAPAPAAAPAAREVGRTGRGRLVVASDPHVGRPVLIEELDRPLGEDEQARLRHLAAAGGPFVQRVLALDADGRRITYELVEGEEVPLSALGPDEAALLAECWPALAAAGLGPAPDRRVVRAPGGPVVRLVGPV